MEADKSSQPLGVGSSEGLGLAPERAETPLGVHWLGGVPYMLTSAPKLTPEQRARLISSGPNAGRVRKAKDRR
jgi:hypothetical protein